ncbi:MAG: bifunctional phosphopantothenoylcysteine decarboxylase/phosphopantothenate--cysteine ligase CoaBC [Nitrospirae bacterium]|nr:bifunctional phosphopantothenoylcysteine decarboxylase/phosphopantothenate--cysteine ligase CoaBC [Nitrospirota bacterium]
MDLPRGRRILLGVTGSIAAYKAVEILRRLDEVGAVVTCVLTPDAARFVPPITFEALSRRRVYTDIFSLDETEEGVRIPHVTLGRETDLILIAPATAHFIGKAAAGLADDLLSALLLTGSAPVMMAPAMDVGMIDHPAVRHNMDLLRERGVEFIGTEVGPLASGLSGPGRLASPDSVVEAVLRRLHPKQDLAGRTLIVSAGPTREPIDPVRYLSNRSSGKMGYALASAARRRGARVILVSGPTALPSPVGVELVSVTTAEEMSREILSRLEEANGVLMAAAVADFRPDSPSPRKIKKGEGMELKWVANPDILGEIAKWKGERIRRGLPVPRVVGFAAESGTLKEEAARKLKEKDLDMIVANPVLIPGAGFDEETNIVTVLLRDGRVVEYPILPKTEVAERVLDLFVALLPPA